MLVTLPGYAWLRSRNAVALAAVFLAALYAAQYLGHPALPGNNPQFPIGWWGWWDQSNYLKSATAFAHLNRSPDQHLYPLAYGLLGALFVRAMPMHAYFAVDLVSLLVALLAFVSFARRCGLAPRWSALVFLLAAAGDPVLFEQWVAPWNTSPVSALVWLLLAIAAAHLDGDRRPALMGLVAVCIPMLRPTDLVLTLPALSACLWEDLRRRQFRGRDFFRFILVGLTGALLYICLHLMIYGPRQSPYMRIAADIGFTLHNFGWKAFVILVDPRAWIGGGAGLLRRCPWLIFGVAGLAPAMARPKTAMLAITLVAHSILYISYVDLQPTGFWRYLNVHYWTWAFPGFALLGVLLARILLGRDELARTGHGRRVRLVAVGSVALVAALLCVRYDPLPATFGESIDALDFPTAQGGFDSIYFGQITVTDAAGSLMNVAQVRGIPAPQGGLRILALTRALREPISVRGANLDGLSPIRLHARLGFGIPFWPWTASDEFYGPR